MARTAMPKEGERTEGDPLSSRIHANFIPCRHLSDTDNVKLLENNNHVYNYFQEPKYKCLNHMVPIAYLKGIDHEKQVIRLLGNS